MRRIKSNPNQPYLPLIKFLFFPFLFLLGSFSLSVMMFVHSTIFVYFVSCICKPHFHFPHLRISQGETKNFHHVCSKEFEAIFHSVNHWNEENKRRPLDEEEAKFNKKRKRKKNNKQSFGAAGVYLSLTNSFKFFNCNSNLVSFL